MANSTAQASPVVETSQNSVIDHIDTYVKVPKPQAGEMTEISIEPGQCYAFDFGKGDITGFSQGADTLTLNFGDDQTITLTNYAEAMSGDEPAVLAFNPNADALVSNDTNNVPDNVPEVIANAEVVEVMDEAPPSEDALQEPQAEIRESEEDGEGTDTAGAVDVLGSDAIEPADIEPASGDESLADIAQSLAELEPAAGDEGGADNTGFGFGSSFEAQGVIPIDGVGPIDSTLLQYSVEFPDTEIAFVPQGAADSSTPDDSPSLVSPSGVVLDESDMDPDTSQSGQIDVDFGADGPGEICGNGDVDVSGSVAGGELTSGGEPVEITMTADGGYVGMAGGVVVFTLTIDPETGEYTYTQIEPFDHADDTDPNDVISLEFGVKVSDADGDTVETVITVIVQDDAPSIEGSQGSVDETDLAEGVVAVGGTVEFDTGNDGGTLQCSGDFGASGSVAGGELTSGGEPVEVALVDGVYVGTAGGETIFTLTLNEDGTYKFKLFGPLDHADGTDPNDSILLEFGVLVVDGDGDSAETTITIKISDDGPLIKGDEKSIDETDLADGAVSVDGEIKFEEGADGGTVQGNGDFNASGSVAGGELTSGGEPVEVTLVDGVYVGTAGGETIFTLTINEDGTYEFTLLGPLDHADTDDPDDVLSLNFGVVVIDGDGDSAEQIITINIADDGPSIENKFKRLDESDLADGPLEYTNTLEHDFGSDGPGEITPIEGGFSVHFDFGGDPQTLTSGGEVVDVQATEDGYVGMVGGEVAFTLTVNPETGEYTYTQFLPLDHPDTADPDDVMWLKFMVEITDADGDTAIATIGIDLHDDGPVAHNDEDSVSDQGTSGGQIASGNVADNDDAGADGFGSVKSVSFGDETVDVPEDGSVSIEGEYGILEIFSDGSYVYTAFGDANGVDVFTYVMCDADGDQSKATLTINVDLDDAPIVVQPEKLTVDETDLDTGMVSVDGQIEADFQSDGPGTFAVNGDFAASGSVAGDELTSNGFPVEVSLADDNVYVGSANGETIFTLTINEDGSYEFTLIGTLDHADTEDHNDSICLEFGFTATDVDGDTASSTIRINVDDDGPSIENKFKRLDESDLVDGPLEYTNTLEHDFGADGPGDITPMEGGFSAHFEFGGDPQTLTSGGEEVVVTTTSDGYVGMVGSEVAFMLTVNPETSEYTYTQFLPLDHPVTDDPNDVFWMKFKVVIADADGDTDIAIIGIDLHDDGPVAHNDEDSVSDQSTSGNVADNDAAGADGFGRVKSVRFGDEMVDVPEDGSVSIEGEYGVLEIFADGSYTYTTFGPADGVDVFTYIMCDADGDQDKATLTINVSVDDVPCVTQSQELVASGNGGGSTAFGVSGLVHALLGTEAMLSKTDIETFTESFNAEAIVSAVDQTVTHEVMLEYAEKGLVDLGVMDETGQDLFASLASFEGSDPDMMTHVADQLTNVQDEHLVDVSLDVSEEAVETAVDSIQVTEVAQLYGADEVQALVGVSESETMLVSTDVSATSEEINLGVVEIAEEAEFISVIDVLFDQSDDLLQSSIDAFVVNTGTSDLDEDHLLKLKQAVNDDAPEAGVPEILVASEMAVMDTAVSLDLEDLQNNTQTVV